MGSGASREEDEYIEDPAYAQKSSAAITMSHGSFDGSRSRAQISRPVMSAVMEGDEEPGEYRQARPGM